MKVGPLMEGERALYSGLANATITPSEHGLSQFAAGQLLRVSGGARSRGDRGKLFVTSARVVFSSHQFNRVTGTLRYPSAACWGRRPTDPG